MKVSFGELDLANRLASKAFLRQRFLLSIQELVPEVLEALYDCSSHAYLRVKPDYYPIAFEALVALNPRPISVEALIDSFERWSNKWNLNSDWSLAFAYDAIGIWCLRPERPVIFTVPAVYYEVTRPCDPPEPPDCWYAYDPIVSQRQHYLNYVREQASRAIQADTFLKYAEPSHKKAFLDSIVCRAEDYCIKVEDYYYKSLAFRHPAESSQLEQHLRWTVAFQVAGESYSKIATEAGVQRTTVTRAVRRILLLLGMNERKGARPGRRFGSRTSSRNRISSQIRRQLAT